MQSDVDLPHQSQIVESKNIICRFQSNSLLLSVKTGQYMKINYIVFVRSIKWKVLTISTPSSHNNYMNYYLSFYSIPIDCGAGSNVASKCFLIMVHLLAISLQFFFFRSSSLHLQNQFSLTATPWFSSTEIIMYK